MARVGYVVAFAISSKTNHCFVVKLKWRATIANWSSTITASAQNNAPKNLSTDIKYTPRRWHF